MPTKPDASSAVDEAIRAIAEAPRWNPAANREFMRTWAGGTEALLNASFQMQNAWLASSPPLLEATFSAQKSLLAAWTTAAEQRQQIILDVWRRLVAETEKRFTPSR